MSSDVSRNTSVPLKTAIADTNAKGSTTSESVTPLFDDGSRRSFITEHTARSIAGQILAIDLEGAIEEMISGNLHVDFFQSFFPEPHFNAEKIKKGNLRLQNTRDTIISYLQKSEPDYSTARTLIGEYLHILQDFYSNTNWVEMKGAIPYEDLGLSGVHILVHSKPSENTCTNCDDGIPGDCDSNLIVAADTLTSGYKSGQQTKKPKGSGDQGKCSHGGRYDQTRNMIATGGINKESHDPQLSPHNSLHEEATLSAMMATENFFLAEGYGLRNNISDDTFLRLSTSGKRV
ncbi:von Willebrand factor A domain-containing protein 7-like [Ptychodera flava]|uniref:von Willebrand factor A domain-containing protein 7-like n=1 Tax=Ptychodera flava TaxID=63121 RepID=UPI003969E523